jgi:hypothetical protein
MSPPESAFRWSARAERAAGLVAADELTDAVIAAEVGISKRQLERWKRSPEFAARVEALVAEARKAVLATGVAVVENRVIALDQRHRLLQQVIRERAAAPEMQSVPGGATGLLVQTIKKVSFPKANSGSRAKRAEALPVDPDDCSEADELVTDDDTCHDPEDAGKMPALPAGTIVVYEVALDTGLLRAMREIEESAAKQLAQWCERQEISGPEGAPLAISLEEAILKVYGPTQSE